MFTNLKKGYKMKKGILVLCLLSSLASADIWSKMFKFQRVQNTPQSMFNYGFQVGYQDAMNGVTNYSPSRDPFVQGYFEGRRNAIYDMMIQERNAYHQQQMMGQEQNQNFYRGGYDD
jgi:hypothetical protein